MNNSLQELGTAVVQFFELVVEKYITHFANPKREWTYFKSLLVQPDINRIQSYLKVLKQTCSTPPPEPALQHFKSLDVPKHSYTTYVSPLREHNIPHDSAPHPAFKADPLHHAKSVPKLVSWGEGRGTRMAAITRRIVDLMANNNLSLAYSQDY